MPTRVQRPRVLVLTHNFPRHAGDISGIGFQPLYRSLGRYLELHFVVPHDKGLREYEQIGDLHIHRFRYASDDEEVLAYRGEMHQRALRQPLLAASFLHNYRHRAQKLVDELYPKSVWAHWWVPGGWVGQKISRRNDLPLVVTCHGTDIHLLHKHRWLRLFAKRVFSQARSINVVSSFLEQRLLKVMDESDLIGKTFVAPLTVDPAAVFFDPRVKRKPGSIISASRFTTQKHLDKLILAVKAVLAAGVNCSLVLYGDGPEESNLRALVNALGIERQVTFAPPVPQEVLAQKYRESQIAALISEREGFGLMLVEAMMCGCAAVGARSGGILDIITQDGVDGLLVEPGDVDSTTEALRRLLCDDELLRSVAAKGRASVNQRFSESEITNRMVSKLLP